MPEPGEFPQPTPTVESTRGLERRQLLTVDEISNIRTDERIGHKIGHTYTLGDRSVSTVFLSPDMDAISDQKRDEILTFLQAKENGEGYRYEPLIVSSLFKQYDIGSKFGLSEDSLYRDFKLIVEDKGKIMLDDWGHIYLRVLDEHVKKSLKPRGATDEQMVTELAGHVFHESVHNAEGNMKQVLFNGKTPFGEIASVTAQLAYYLDEGYNGPTSYNDNRFSDGLNKVRSGNTNGRDYDIATYVGGTLILNALREAYPKFLPEIKDMDPIVACYAIVGKMSSDERQSLIPTLKKAMANSADEKVFEDVLNKAKQENNSQPESVTRSSVPSVDTQEG